MVVVMEQMGGMGDLLRLNQTEEEEGEEAMVQVVAEEKAVTACSLPLKEQVMVAAEEAVAMEQEEAAVLVA